MKFSALLPLSFLLVSTVAQAAQVSAKKDGTQIISEPRKGAALVKELKKGETIDAGDRSGMFWKVKTSDGKEGYVSVIAVQREAGKDGSIQTALHEAAMKARDSTGGNEATRARSAVMGVRGLNENNELAEIGSLRPDLRAIYHMEDRSVNARRVDRLEVLVQKELENMAVARSK